ncbi:MAG: BMP family protein [Spirochaetia bacterium]|nr:BMP family protein [Spirochaetia bacterium]
MKKSMLAIVLMSALALPIFANGQNETAKPETAAPAATSNTVKVALIVENTIDDKGWCQAMYDGIKEAQKEMPGRIEMAYSEKMKPVDAGSAARQYVADGYNIIIGHGAQYANVITEMADEFPDVTFAFGTSSQIVADNVFTYMPESEETGYLSGMIAGMLTKKDKLGVVGPVDGGDSARYNRGFVLGAQSVNPSVKIMVGHTGSFSDYIKAGQLAKTDIQEGADVLTGSSQQALGALRSVAEYKDKDIWWVGQDMAQMATEEGYKCVAASSYNYGAVIVSMVKKLDAGVKGGECIPMNFNNNGFVFGFNPSLKSMYEGKIEDAVNAQIAKFKATPNTIDWKSVDYSKL